MNCRAAVVLRNDFFPVCGHCRATRLGPFRYVRLTRSPSAATPSIGGGCDRFAAAGKNQSDHARRRDPITAPKSAGPHNGINVGWPNDAMCCGINPDNPGVFQSVRISEVFDPEHGPASIQSVGHEFPRRPNLPLKSYVARSVIDDRQRIDPEGRTQALVRSCLPCRAPVHLGNGDERLDENGHVGG